MSYQQLDVIADSIVPLLLLSLFLLPLLWRLPRPGGIWLRAALGFALTNLLARFVRKLELVSGPGLEVHNFPSTHYASALCALTFLVLLRPRLWPLWIAVGTAYAGLVVYQEYHTPLELLGSAFAIPLCWLVWRAFGGPLQKPVVSDAPGERVNH